MTVITPARLARALQLDADRAGDGWLVGTWLVDDATGCPCPDARIHGPMCKHRIRVELAALSPELLEGLRLLLVGGAQVPARPEIARPGRSQAHVSSLQRPAEPGLPLSAFAPPLRSRRTGPRRPCFYSGCPEHGQGAA